MADQQPQATDDSQAISSIMSGAQGGDPQMKIQPDVQRVDVNDTTRDMVPRETSAIPNQIPSVQQPPSVPGRDWEPPQQSSGFAPPPQKGSPAQRAIDAATGKKNHGGLFAHVFDALAGHDIKMDENGDLYPVQRTGTKAIMRGIVAGAITGMAASEHAKGGLGVGLATGAQARMDELQFQDKQMGEQQEKAFTRRKELYEMNMKQALNHAQIDDYKSQARERAVSAMEKEIDVNRRWVSQLDDEDIVSPQPVDEAELEEGMKSGKYHAGDHLGPIMGIGKDADGNPEPLHLIIRGNSDAQINVTPEDHDKYAELNPNVFPKNISDGAKTYKMSAPTLHNALLDGAHDLHNANYLSQLKDDVKKVDADLAGKIPDFDMSNPQNIKAMRKLGKYLAGKGSISAALTTMAKKKVDPKSGDEYDTADSKWVPKIYAMIGGGDPSLGMKIVDAQNDVLEGESAERKRKMTEDAKKIDDTKAKQIVSEYEHSADKGGHTAEQYAVAKGILKESVKESGQKAANVKVNVINTEARNVDKIKEVSEAKASGSQEGRDIQGQVQWYKNRDAEAAKSMDVTKLDENSPPVLLADGKITLEQLSKRTNNFNAAIQVADKYLESKSGSGVQWAKRSTDFKFASQPATQSMLKYLDSLTGRDNKSGNLGVIIAESDKLGRTRWPSINDAAAWARLQSGDPGIVRFHTAAIEVSDQIGKVLQGGGTGNGTSDAKLKQAQELFDTGFNKEQIRESAQIMRDLLANRKNEFIGDNFYLQQTFGKGRGGRGSNPAPDGTKVNTPKGVMVKRGGEWVPDTQ